jgi:hypothetical protein
MQRRTKARSAIEPTWWVTGLNIDANGLAPLRLQRAHQRLA